MSNKERGSHGNCYCTFDLRVRWLRWACRRDGDSMNVGDLVRIKGTSMVHLVKRVESVANFYKSLPPTTWEILDGQPVPYKASKVEVVNASR